MGILETIIESTDAKPVGSVNGVNVYTFEDMQKVNNKRLAEEKLTGQRVEVGIRPMNPDGTFRRIRTPGTAVNLDRYLENRFRAVKDGATTKYQIVTDYRAIEDQKRGRIYTNVLPAYVIQIKNHKPEYLETIKVKDTEFLSGFTSSLDNESMIAVKNVLPKATQEAEKVSIL